MASGVLAEAALILGYEDVKEMEEAAAAAEGGLEALLSARMSSLCEHLTETALQRDEDAEKVRQLSFALAREAQAGSVIYLLAYPMYLTLTATVSTKRCKHNCTWKRGAPDRPPPPSCRHLFAFSV
eukprot:TRINITY_DN36242_c0_g3_i1.p2 TRINITY_DN36242_c0_g3~~TRINITY_DN36242_c0_g3_i1.p2  ORF type:complete len:126 (+),score=29.06 TRINITY_DN36242_c0_g3_i1:113-490(+)